MPSSVQLPATTVTERPSPARAWRALVILSGLALITMGGMVLIGWHIRSPFLVQIHPLFAPMAYASCYGFLAGGTAFLALTLGNRWLTAGLGCALIVLGMLGLGQSIGGINLSLEGWLFQSHSTFSAAHTRYGSMAAAGCFLIWGVSFLLLSRPSLKPRPVLVLSFLGSASIVLSGLVILEYLTGIASTREQLPRMAVQEATGFLVSGLCILMLAYRHTVAQGIAVVRWLSVGVGIAFVTATLVLWQALSNQHHQRVERMVLYETAHIQQQLLEGMPAQFKPLVHFAESWDANGKLAPEELTRETGTYMGMHPGCQAIGLVGRTGELQWIQTLQDARNLENGVFGSDEQKATFFRLVQRRPGLTVSRTPASVRGGRRMLLAYAPLKPSDNGPVGILAVLRIQELLDSILNFNVAPHYAISIFDGEDQIYGRLAAEREYENAWGKVGTIRLYNITWQVHAWPTPAAMASEGFSLAKLSLIAGLLMAGLLALAVHLALMSRRRARELEIEMGERKQAEGALRSSEAKYRSLIENLEQGVFLKDPELRFVAANKHFCQGLGKVEADIIGKSDLDFFPPELAEKYHADDRRVLLDGQKLESEAEYQVDGKPRVARVIKTPVKDAQGLIVGVLGIHWDVTDHRILEAQLQQAQKMDAIGQLAGGVAHDFNNLLTAILGNLSLVVDALGGDDPHREFLLAAEQAGTRAAQLTRQLLGFSRRTMLQTVPTSLNRCVEEALRLLGRTFDPRIKMEFQPAPDLWVVQADASQLNQVLMNLCLNARDAMSNGGRICIQTENVVLDEDYARLHLDARPGEFVRLRVEDTGHGIAPQVLKRIFEPFFTTKGAGKGTGLGLAMVFGIIKQHHGWVECSSEPGEGARFDIYLPRERDVAATHSTNSSPSAQGGKETILLADDEPMIRSLGSTILRQYGYQVVLAEDGQVAVETYTRLQDSIQLVIMDLTMPRLSGRDAFRQLLQINPEVRVVFASGYSSEQMTDVEQDRAIGFVGKPYRPAELARVVRAALDGTRAEANTATLLA